MGKISAFIRKNDINNTSFKSHAHDDASAAPRTSKEIVYEKGPLPDYITPDILAAAFKLDEVITALSLRDKQETK
jgi:hypothetical protein